MYKVFKYEITEPGLNHIVMPIAARILSVQLQGTKICLWALVNPELNVKAYYVLLVGTGHEITHNVIMHISTFQIGAIVLHAFLVEP